MDRASQRYVLEAIDDATALVAMCASVNSTAITERALQIHAALVRAVVALSSASADEWLEASASAITECINFTELAVRVARASEPEMLHGALRRLSALLRCVSHREPVIPDVVVPPDHVWIEKFSTDNERKLFAFSTHDAGVDMTVWSKICPEETFCGRIWFDGVCVLSTDGAPPTPWPVRSQAARTAAEFVAALQQVSGEVSEDEDDEPESKPESEQSEPESELEPSQPEHEPESEPEQSQPEHEPEREHELSTANEDWFYVHEAKELSPDTGITPGELLRKQEITGPLLTRIKPDQLVINKGLGFGVFHATGEDLEYLVGVRGHGVRVAREIVRELRLGVVGVVEGSVEEIRTRLASNNTWLDRITLKTFAAALQRLRGRTLAVWLFESGTWGIYPGFLNYVHQGFGSLEPEALQTWLGRLHDEVAGG